MGTAKIKSDNPTDSAQQPPEYLVVGRIVKPHGIRGGLVVEPQSKSISNLSSGKRIYLGTNYEVFNIQHFAPHRRRYLLNLETINTRDRAEVFRDAIVYLRFEDSEPLPKGEYYDWQLLGMTVVTDESEILGELEQIIETGANDVYLIRTDSDDEILIPAIESVIKTVDLENKQMIVHLIPGLLPGS